ncbi:cell wall metabolism sensor histidine kinase WalK [Ferruginibacter sp. HRS2-29]|uniref:sensor histidine kinase n=1 Tax=Ferruginibacter sp. HRS2-29 TaxID=2487334 RepID=UPI0020CFB380|nr:HAMP domain-containing sensor histidine kinase [Ferruginibacter sp. HRS2-29]
MGASSLRRLFVLAIAAGLGLLVLQAYWIHKEWQNTADILQRQVDYSLQASVDSELVKRKDVLKNYLEEILSDTTLIDINTRYNKKEGKWIINMYDAGNRKDYSSWSNEDIPIGPELTRGQKKLIIQNYVLNNVIKNVEDDIIFFYTQKFGTLWSEKMKHLSVDSVYLQKIFARELSGRNIRSPFIITYTDTSRNPLPVSGTRNAFNARPVSINYATVNDTHKKYVVTASAYNPAALLFSRVGMALLMAVLLLSLTFYCLYRMYRTILQQKQLHELKNDFIGNMTHELKTPIATVTAAIDGLQYFKGLANADKAERYFDISRTELQRLDDIVSKVLDMSIYEQQRIVLHKEPIAVKQLLEHLIQAFEIKGAAFSCSLQCQPPGISVVADKTHLKNVLYNLVDNAIKYVPAKLHLSFSVHKDDDDHIVIAVQDNGDGIDAKHLPRLFEKFFRIPSGNIQNVKGFGLGLFYAKQIIEQHNGSIHVSSGQNRGTIFRIILPVN